MASYCRLSVCRSVCGAVHCGAQGRCRGWKLHRRVPRTALSIHFSRQFCCGMYRSATTHSEKSNRRNIRVWNSHWERGHVTMAIRDAVFSAVRFCSYAIGHIRSAIALLSDSYTLIVQFCIDRWPITPMTQAKVQQPKSFPATVVIDKFPV